MTAKELLILGGTGEASALAQRALSTPVRELRRRTVSVTGEQRLSNFLIWQAAYAELLFVDTLWPDFDAATFAEAVAAFSNRQRRFGVDTDWRAPGNRPPPR